MKIIIGLGNPGKEYEKTPHNAGKFILDALASHWNTAPLEQDDKSGSLTTKTKIDKEIVWLVFPTKYMNESGPALKKTFQDFKLNPKPKDVLIIHDDLDIELGRAKLSQTKSSAGHKGVKSIFSTLKSENAWRLRIGVASKKKLKNTKDYLLSNFSASEQKKINQQKKRLIESIELWIQDPNKAQQLVNTTTSS